MLLTARSCVDRVPTRELACETAQFVEHGADTSLIAANCPEIGKERHIGNPLRFSDLQTRPAGRAPLLGEHTEDVLRRWLDLDDAALRAAIDHGACR